MLPRTRLVLSIVALLGVVFVGTIGYMVIEEDRSLSFLEAVYMTVITVSTVGYNEVWRLSPGGRLWTIVIVVFGISTVSVAFTSLITLFVSGELRIGRERMKMETMIGKMQDHIILCGFGRMGRLVVAELARRRLAVVVLEILPEHESDLREAGVPFLIGDATEEESLIQAGLMNARALVSALPHDADNVYITLTAHALKPDAQIIARAEQPATESKLKRAGATRVICPQVMGATRIANVITRPNVVDFFDVAHKGVDLEMDEYVIGQDSVLAGKTLRDSPLRQKTGASVVAIRRADGRTVYNPDPNAALEAGDTLILVGPAGVSSLLDTL